MNKAMLFMDQRRTIKSLIIWALAVGATMWLVVILYPLVEDMYALIPEEFMSFVESFGGIPDNPMEYYSTEGGIMLQILSTIFAALLGYNAMNREEREKTSDSIYTLPISRRQFFIHKMVFITIQILIFSVIVLLFTLIGFIGIGYFENMNSFFLYYGLHTLMLFYIAGFGALLACVVKDNRKSTIAIAIPLPLYLFSLLSTLTDNELLINLKYITPFTFCDPVVILKRASDIDLVSLFLFTGLFLVSIGLAYILFRRKEFRT